MTPKERSKTLREMLKHPYANPDPTTWLIAADLVESTCYGAECCKESIRIGITTGYWRNATCAVTAGQWRFRGQHFEKITLAYAWRDPNGGIIPWDRGLRVVQVEEVHVAFQPKKKTTFVTVSRFGNLAWCAGYWYHNPTSQHRERYAAKLTIQLLDDLWRLNPYLKAKE